MNNKSSKVGKERFIYASLLAFIPSILLFLFIPMIAGCINNFLFFPEPISPVISNAIKQEYKNVEEITITATDSTCLKGWYVKQSTEEKSPLLIYFGGNAEEVSGMIEHTKLISGWSVALINYRGYGLSEGCPNESSVCSDALNIYDYFAGKQEIDAGRIIVWGRSIGTGVAVYVAEQRPVKAVILVSPYDSINSVAQGMAPIVPVWLIFRNRFNSISRAPSITAPMLALLASEDEVITIQHSKRLIAKWAGKTTVVTIEGAGHNTIIYGHDGLYWKSINEFLAQF